MFKAGNAFPPNSTMTGASPIVQSDDLIIGADLAQLALRGEWSF